MELYIHIPFCMKKCDYCDFLSAPYDVDVRRAYTNALCNEIAFFGERYGDEVIDTVFIGGGTPSWLEMEWMAAIMEQAHRSFSIAEDAEISMECNPGTIAKAAFSSYRSWGLNRLSIGLQSANDEELAVLGRIHTYERFLKTFDSARRSGIYNINVDIMTGLPGQTPATLQRTLQSVIGLKPEHISAYALSIEEGTPFYDRYRDDVARREAGMATEFLPDEDEAYYLSKQAQQVLGEHGYRRYEISNYAKNGMVCRHNIGYWTRVPYLGVGLGASSLLDGMRYTNDRDMETYLLHCGNLEKGMQGDSPMWEVQIALSRMDEIEEFMYLGLRMTEGISREDFRQRFGQPIDSYYKNTLEELKVQGMLCVEGGRIYLTEQGMDLSNRVLAEFLFG